MKNWIYNDVNGEIENADSEVMPAASIARVFGLKTIGEAEFDANGRLLASAPDLLRASVNVLRLLKRLQSYDLDAFEHSVSESVSELTAAIAKTGSPKST